MARANQLPQIPNDWLDSTPADSGGTDMVPAPVQLASTLDYDGAARRLTLTRGDGTVQQFPAANNPQRNSGGRWPNGTFNYERHTTHPDDAPDSGYGSNGNHIFTVPDRSGMGVHSGRVETPDGLGRSGVGHATLGCIRTTDEGTAAIRDAMAAGDPVTRIMVRNNP
jgi:hypothetical protein